MIEAAPASRQVPAVLMQEGTMTRLTGRLIAAARDAARNAYEKVETRVLVAQGRKAVKHKAKTVTKVSRKAAKTGAMVGALTAAGVVAHEIRKRRKLDRG
jgi:NADH:ubiquinone oxidoreductase subunit D